MAFRKQFRAGKNNLSAALATAVVAVSAAKVWASPSTSFTAGDLVVSTYGSSTAATTDGALTPISLLEFSTSGGAAVLTDTLPTTNSGVNLGIVGEYGSNSEGNIQLSANGLDLTFGAYSATAAAAGIQATTNADNGTDYHTGTAFSHDSIEVAQSANTDVPRVAVVVNAAGQADSSTVLNDIYNTENPRSVYSATGSTGSAFYISGQGDATSSNPSNTNNQGIFTGTVGMNTVTSPGTPPTPVDTANSTRFVTSFNNNLYFSSDTSASNTTGIFEFTGSPTGAATPTQITPGNNGLTKSAEVFYSPEGFYFANSTTLYVADTGQPKTGSTGDGGIQKWTYNGSKWVLDYTLVPTVAVTDSNWIAPGNPTGANDGETGFEAITGQVVGGTVNLYAVSYTLNDDDPDGLYAISDTLSATTNPGDTFSILASALGNAGDPSSGTGGQVFKGVSFAPVPEPTSLSLLGVGSLLMLRRRKPRIAEQ